MTIWDPTGEALQIRRVPLRMLLADGLGDRIRCGAAYTSHQIRDDGRVVAHFDDGSTDIADVLVGADGSRSRVAAALAGQPTSAPVGLGGLAARTPLNAATRRLLPAVLDHGAAFALGPDGTGMFFTKHDPASRAAINPTTCREIPAVTEPPALIWSLIALDFLMPAEATRTLDGPGLLDFTLQALHGWPEDLRALVRAADPASAAYYGFYAADPDTELTPWPAGPVTALGDAVHAMPPTAGRAASTAIRDADHLATELVAADQGTSTIPLATLRSENDGRLRPQTQYANPSYRCAGSNGSPTPSPAGRPDRPPRPGRTTLSKGSTLNGQPARPTKCLRFVSRPVCLRARSRHGH